MKTDISVIIPTLHRKKSVVRLLESLFHQNLKNAEVVVVEQGDNNGKEYLQFAKKYNICLRYFFSNERNTARAKNIGAREAKGRYFVFFDDDVVVHKNVVTNLVKNFIDDTIGCVAGRIITPGQKVEETNTHVGRVSLLGNFTGGFSSTIRQDVDTPVGCNMAFPKEIFDRAGGFDEQFLGAIREESDLSLRIKKLGFRVVFDPTAVVTHLREPEGGGRKTEGRLAWYFNFFNNETYFFLKHRPKILLPVFLLTRWEWAVRCMFGFGREVSLRSFLTPGHGVLNGIKRYRMLATYENRR